MYALLRYDIADSKTIQDYFILSSEKIIHGSTYHNTVDLAASDCSVLESPRLLLYVADAMFVLPHAVQYVANAMFVLPHAVQFVADPMPYCHRLFSML